MNLTTTAREELLAHLDGLFEPQGFKRRKRSQAWRKRISNDVSHSIHLNFGLHEKHKHISIMPSLNIRFESIEADCIESGITGIPSTDTATFGETLPTFSGRNYEWSDGESLSALAEMIHQDVQNFGHKYLASVSEINQVIDLLALNDGKIGRCLISQRARYLPLALAKAGRTDEALRLLPQLAAEIQYGDIMLPNYGHFVSWFTKKYGPLKPALTGS